MSPHIKIETRSVVTGNDDELGEFELRDTPCEWSDLLVKRVGDKLVVGYLVLDDSGTGNPLTECDGNGDLFLAGDNNSIWDDEREVRRQLYCADGRWSSEDPSTDYIFTLPDGTRTTLWELAAKDVLASISQDFELMQAYVEHLEFECDEGETWDQAFASIGKEVWADLLDANGYYCEMVEKRAFELYAEHWERIAGPFVVPVDYSSHYETHITVSSWDGDYLNLPGGVWVADDDCIENILWDFKKAFCVQVGNERETRTFPRADKSMGTYDIDVPILNLVFNGEVVVGNLRGGKAWCRAFMKYFGHLYFKEISAKTRDYAALVLEEVSNWASGNVYGCVVETFAQTNVDEPDEVPTWEQVDIDSCWCFIGQEYAEESLKRDFFDPIVKKHEGGV